MSEFNYIQLPPDGTGKKSKHTIITDLSYISGTIAFDLGDTITTDAGFLGTVIEVDGTVAAGQLHIVVNHKATTALVPSATALKVDGITNAISDGDSELIYNQDVVLVGGNNPLNHVSVTDQGALLTQAPSGVQSFDAFGKLMTSESTTVREYQPLFDTLPDEFHEETAGAGTITWNDTRHIVDMSIGDADGDFTRRRSNLYHKYQVGVATTVMMTVFMGSGGHINTHAHIGLFDDRDGVFFGFEGDGMNVVLRSSVSGSIVNTSYPREEWNVDRLDGSGDANNISRVEINPLAVQILFIDFQWLGGGRIRFGFVIDGDPIVCHEINNANIISNPYMRTGSLPLTYELYNAGTPSPAAPSNLYCIAAAIKCEGKFEPKESLQSGALLPAVTIPANDGLSYQHVGTVRTAGHLTKGIRETIELTDMVIESGFPSTITSNLVDFSTSVAEFDIIQLSGVEFNYEQLVYRVESVTSGSPSVITIRPLSGLLNRETPANATIDVLEQFDNRSISIINDMTLSDMSASPRPYLMELVKNATLYSPVTGVLTITNIVGGTGYTTNTVYETTGGTGTNCRVQVVETGGVVSEVYINRCGDGYTVGDTLTIVGGGNNATFDVLTIGPQAYCWADAYPGNALVAAKEDTCVTGIGYDGQVIYTTVLEGTQTINLTSIFGMNNELLIRKADILVMSDIYSVRIKTLDPAHEPSLLLSLSWKEIR